MIPRSASACACARPRPDSATGMTSIQTFVDFIDADEKRH